MKLAAWTMAWLISTAVATFGYQFFWENNTVLKIIFITINVLVGIGMIIYNRKLIIDANELERKIQLESMGLTLGLTLIVGIANSLMDQTNLIKGDAEISLLVMFMGVCYIVTVFINNKKYSEK
jgi:hypothetical protein